MYILTFYSLSDFWGQLFVHLCLFWTLTAAERSAPTLGLTCSSLLTPRGSPLPASPEPPCEDTPSPILLLPKPRSTVSSKGHFKPSSFYSAEKKPSTTKTQSLQPGPTLPSLTPVGQTLAGPSAEEVKQHLSDTLRRSYHHVRMCAKGHNNIQKFQVYHNTTWIPFTPIHLGCVPESYRLGTSSVLATGGEFPGI